MPKAKQWSIFLNSVFFVLGFSLIFSIVGVLLQSVLANIAYDVQKWLGYIGGALIIVFGVYLLGLIRIPILEREHKIRVKKKFRFSYITSFVFGSAFAVGWTPCVGVTLGAILTFAITDPASAFFLMFAYSLGLGIPFLLVGLFTNQAVDVIDKFGDKMKIFNKIFGVVLIGLGWLVFTNTLSRIANIPFLTEILSVLEGGTGSAIAGLTFIGMIISFTAGFVSFLSPCVLPLIPGFLSYLATTAYSDDKKKR